MRGGRVCGACTAAVLALACAVMGAQHPTPGALAGTARAALTNTSAGVNADLAISFPDPLHGWIAASSADASTLLATADGGRHWDPRAVPEPDTYGDIDFVSAQQGWVVTAHSLLITTTGGRTWRTTSPLSPTDIARIDFVDGRNGWRVFNGLSSPLPLFERTGDGGRTWLPLPTPCPDSQSRLPVDAFTFKNIWEGWAICTGFTHAHAPYTLLLHTGDGGMRWTRVAGGWPGSGSPRGLPVARLDTPSLSDLFFLDHRHGWLGLPYSGLFATGDGGRSWRRVSALPSLQYVRFLSPQRGYVVQTQAGIGAEHPGVVLETLDSGHSWQQIYPPAPPPGIRACTGSDVQGQAFWDGSSGRVLGGLFVEDIGRPCLIRGQPRVQIVDTQGRVLPVLEPPPRWGSGNTVVIRQGQRASAVLWWSNWCGQHSLDQFSLRVTLPGQPGEFTATLQGTPYLMPRCDTPGMPSSLIVGTFHPIEPPASLP